VTLGLALLAGIVLVRGGTIAGAQAAGWFGAVAGGALGAIAAFYVYLRFLVQWQARRLVPSVLKEKDWNSELGDLVRAQEQIKAMAERALER
jgi:hypothetical protein